MRRTLNATLGLAKFSAQSSAGGRRTHLFATLLVVAACTAPENGKRPTPTHSGTTKAPLPPVSQQVTTTTVANVDAGPAKDDAHYAGALFQHTPIFSDMEWPSKEGKSRSKQVGYLRQGGRAAVIPEPRSKSNCSEGWYELEAGGFVCGKHVTLDMNHPKLRTAPHVPYNDRPLPYDYGYNAANGTPVYRVVPSKDERLENEPWLSPRKKRAVDDERSEEAADADAGAGPAWFLKEYDGGKPPVTLDDLKGDGPVVRRMVKGFFLGLDKSFFSGGARWWRTTATLIVPADRIVPWKPPTEFHGVWLDARGAEKEPLPHKMPALVGFVLSTKAKKYTVSNKHASPNGELPRHTIMRLTGETASIGGQIYEETEEGFWFRLADGTKTKPASPPSDLKAGEKWFDVSINQQTLVAFEGDKPVYATMVSTGRTSPIKDKDHPTPTGTFRIREKHIASTMDGDVASDGPYSIEDVPWIMYFQGSYALHGAFWHGNFGRKQSHGCVNLAPEDAKTLFGWSEPALPDGWHGVMSTPEHQGTYVVVHD